MNRPVFDLEFSAFSGLYREFRCNAGRPLEEIEDVKLRFCFVSNCLKGVDVLKHSHPTLELIYYVDGSGRSLIGKRMHEVRRHVLAIVPAHVLHDQINRTDVTSICVGVSQSGLESLQGTWDDTSGNVGRLFPLLVEELKNKRAGFELVSRGILIEIQGLIHRLAHEAAQPPKKEALVRKAVEIIHRHEGACSVADLASRLYISRDYLRHLFGEYAGQSPIKYILEVRLKKAQALLADKNLHIGEVAAKCGFEDVYYFSRLFRKMTGQTPSNFRKAASTRPTASKRVVKARK